MLLVGGIIVLLLVALFGLVSVMRTRKLLAAALGLVIAASSVGLYFYWSGAYNRFVAPPSTEEKHAQFLVALWQYGLASFSLGEYDRAIAHWTLLRGYDLDNPEILARIDEMIAEARRLQAGAEDDPTAAERAPTATDESAATISVTVTLADHLAAKAAADDTLFVYARAAQGPPMPLAIKRLSAGDLPATIRLGAKDAMMPSMTLDNFDRVKIIARISKSGMAKPQPGDLYGESEAISPAAGQVSVEIGEVVE